MAGTAQQELRGALSDGHVVKRPEMLIFLKLIDGRTKDLDLEGTDTIAVVRMKVAAVTNIHPEHQRLVLLDGGIELLDDTSTVADHNIRLEAEIGMVAQPEPRIISLNVGGTLTVHDDAVHARGLATGTHVRRRRGRY